MAQTTDAMSGVNAQIEFSPDGSVWTDQSGSANRVEAGGGNRQSGEAYSFDGDGALITSGKKEPREVTVGIVYTETGGESFEQLRALYEATGGSDCYIRWSPGGGNVGDLQFTTSKGIITQFPYPSPDSGESGPIIVEAVVKVGDITTATIV